MKTYYKKHKIGHAVQGLADNVQAGIENLQINGEQVKQIGTAIVVPIIVSTAMGKGVGIFSSQAAGQAVRRSVPRVMRTSTATRVNAAGFGRVATIPMRSKT